MSHGSLYKKTGRLAKKGELTSLYPVAFGQIPDNITEKNIDLLREYAQKFLAEASPIPLRGYELSPYRPNCGPKTLWQSFFSDPSTLVGKTIERTRCGRSRFAERTNAQGSRLPAMR